MKTTIDLTGLSEEDAKELRQRAATMQRLKGDGISSHTRFVAVGPFGRMTWKVSDLGMQDDMYQCSAVEQHYTEVDGKRFQHLSIWALFSADEIRAGLMGGGE